MSQNVPACSGTEGNTDSSVPPKNSNAKHWGFTLNNPTNDEEIKIRTYFTEKCSDFRAQEETGDLGTTHLQGYAGFKCKTRFTALKKLCSRAHWYVVKNIPEYIEYVCKSDTATGRWWGNITPLFVPEPTQPWQLNLIQELVNTPNPRKIIWYYDPIGGKGKSVLCKWLAAYHNALIVCGKNADLKYGIQQVIKNSGVAPKIILLDCPRTLDPEFISYTGIEEVKNGCFFATKYEGGMCLFNNPHVVVFSNQKPKVHNLSADRWEIREI